jgi:hypothetical protein
MPKNPPVQKISQIGKLFENSIFLPQGVIHKLRLQKSRFSDPPPSPPSLQPLDLTGPSLPPFISKRNFFIENNNF